MERRERAVSIDGIEGSRAMDLASYERHEREFTDAEIRDDIISYLGEYRLNIQKYEYKLRYKNGKICDARQEEAMTIKAQRAIESKRVRGEVPYREEAELLGIQRIEDQLRFVQKQPATFFWASPQGPKEEGFGNYGFTFVGKYDPLTSDISMTAIRIENPTIEQFNKAMSSLTNREWAAQKAVDFLMSPSVIGVEVDLEFIENVLQHSFSFKKDMREQKISNRVLNKLEPKIEEFVKTVRNLPKEERLRLFHTLENYAISLKERYEEEKESGVTIIDNYRDDRLGLYALTDKYGYQPPVAMGSCGSTGNTKNNALLNFGLEALMNVLYGDESSECTICGGDGSDGHYHCPNNECNKRYADETKKPTSDRTKKCSCGFEFGC